MQKQIDHIVHFPRWYPNDLDPQNGVFIEKHIRCISEIAPCSVIFVAGKTDQKKLFVVKELREENINTFICYFRKIRFLAPIQYLLCFYMMWRKVTFKHGYPQVIHAHVGLRTVVLAWFVSAVHRIPYIISEHWSGFILGDYERRYRLYRSILKRVYKKADAISVVSEKLRQGLLRHDLIPKDNTFIIPNVISRYLTKSEVVRGDVAKIIVVADLRDRIKNVSAILRVLSDLKSKSFKLTIVGWGPDKDMLEDLAKSLDFGNNVVEFKGVINNAEVFYNLYHSDFLISNSRFETFGMIPLEALSCGTPVICTFEGCPEEIHAPENGYFIPKDDDEALKRSILQMLENYMEFDSDIMSKTASIFYPEQVGEEFVNLYNYINK